MVRVAIISGNNQVIVDSPPQFHLTDLFNIVKEKKIVNGNAEDYIFFSDSVIQIDSAELSSILQGMNGIRLCLIPKEAMKPIEKFSSTFLPSLVSEAVVLHPLAKETLTHLLHYSDIFSRAQQEDVSATIMSVIPYDRIDSLDQDAKLSELTKWFKEEFFTFIHSPDCRVCKAKTGESTSSLPTATELSKGASRVEVYKCNACGASTRFPRYNKVEPLLETKCGRCGEFVTAFASILFVIGFDVRAVHDCTDHVWIEVWLDSKQRYVHVDPCENIIDAPYTYEKGWGKKLTWVIAIGKNCCVDVTARYTQDFAALRKRRSNPETGPGAIDMSSQDPEPDMEKIIKFRNDQLMIGMSEEEKAELKKKIDTDLASISVRADLKPEEERKRISGAQ